MAGPLEGLRVIDCTRGTAGPRATGILADYGADVVWVEPAGGDPFRDLLAVPYASFNRGKRSIELPLPAQVDQLHGLLAAADVFVQSWRPGVADRLGLGYGALHRRHPHLVYCSISGFGADGPHSSMPGHEALIHALVGTMAEQVGHRPPPIYEGLPFASIGAAYLACIGTLAALYRRHEDGVGRQVETSLLDGALAYLSMTWGDSDKVSAAPPVVPGSIRLVARTFRCSDDEYLGVHTAAVGAFGRLMRVLGTDDRIVPDPLGADMLIPLDDEQRVVMNEEIPSIFETRPRAYWLEKLTDADICAIPELHATQVFDEPQARFSEMVLTVDDPVLGVVEQVAPPATFPRHPRPDPAPAPRVGQHTAEVLAEARAPITFSAGSAPQDRPLLDGLRVLDLGAYFAGPFSSRLLADLGADVIKVETTLGDQLRGIARAFGAAQANKRAISLNLKDQALRPALEGLIDWADVVHHNMRPGAAERMGVDDSSVRTRNPRAVYLYAPGWGSKGPDAGRQAFAPLLSGYCGTGYEVAGSYNPPLFPVGNEDPGNGLVGAVAVLMALVERQRTGKGQYIENPQLNATMAHTQHIVRRPNGEIVGAERLDPLQLGMGALDRLYETSDGWLCLVAASDREIRALGAVIGVDILGDERFARPTGRTENSYELESLLADVFSGKSTADWVANLSRAGVGVAAPVLADQVSRFHRDPENRRTLRVMEVQDPDHGAVRQIANLVKVSDCVVRPHRLAPALGVDTDAVLADLGYPADLIADLRARGSVR